MFALMTEIGKEKTTKNRPPVVVVLGHVDHGKTKLLDTIRKTKVAEKESGGITQHIGAYQAETDGKTITFLDTPGHEAFSAIRARGARIADIAILVVAADESVKPQTKEAIKIIESEKIPVIIAINKIDKEGANPQKVRQDLAAENILVEDWGGKVPVLEISAKEGRNIQELLDIILLVAELEELKEDISSPAEGIIIESRLDKRRGHIASAIIQKGVLRPGDWLVVGTIVGKIKSMEDFRGSVIFEARPSQPVLITGWPSAPDIGKPFVTADSKDAALRISENNVDLAPLFSFIKESAKDSEETPGKKILNLVLKADFSGSLEALESALQTIKSDEVGYRVVRYDIGNIAETDVQTAVSAKAQIIGFRVAAEESAKKLAEKEKIAVASFDVIYELIEHVRREMSGLLESKMEKIPLGELRVLAIFKKDQKNWVVGGKVISGKAKRGALIGAIRNGEPAKIGKLNQLQHNKEDVAEVREGLEAGMKIELAGPSEEIKIGENLEIYEEKKIERTL